MRGLHTWARVRLPGRACVCVLTRAYMRVGAYVGGGYFRIRVYIFTPGQYPALDISKHLYTLPNMKIYLIAKPTWHNEHGGGTTSYDIRVDDGYSKVPVKYYRSIEAAHKACEHNDRIVEIDIKCTPP
jgi:hypothetical protein